MGAGFALTNTKVGEEKKEDTLMKPILDISNLRRGLEGIREQGRIAPYVIAWILGVPGSILLVIFLLRGCH
jgi:hypothetical protein